MTYSKFYGVEESLEAAENDALGEFNGFKELIAEDIEELADGEDCGERLIMHCRDLIEAAGNLREVRSGMDRLYDAVDGAVLDRRMGA